MHRCLPLIVVLTLAGCDIDFERHLRPLFESERPVNEVILESKPISLESAPTSFTSAEPMKVIGRATSVCLVLQDGVSIQDMNVFNQAFESAMQKSRVKVDVLLYSGQRVTLRQPLQAWRLHGAVLHKEELSACAITPCNAVLPAGAVISRVEITADPALYVRGIYWKSELDSTETLQSLSGLAAANPKAMSCSS